MAKTKPLITRNQKVISFRPTYEQRKKINEIADYKNIKTIPVFIDTVITVFHNKLEAEQRLKMEG